MFVKMIYVPKVGVKKQFAVLFSSNFEFVNNFRNTENAGCYIASINALRNKYHKLYPYLNSGFILDVGILLFSPYLCYVTWL